MAGSPEEAPDDLGLWAVVVHGRHEPRQPFREVVHLPVQALDVGTRLLQKLRRRRLHIYMAGKPAIRHQTNYKRWNNPCQASICCTDEMGMNCTMMYVRTYVRTLRDIYSMCIWGRYRSKWASALCVHALHSTYPAGVPAA